MVLITGASSGFGEEFARRYAKQGHSLVLVARRLDRLQALAEALRRQHRIDVVVEQVDLSDIAAVIHLHRHLQERGIAIDILIKNAGHGLQGPFVDSQLDAALAMAGSKRDATPDCRRFASMTCGTRSRLACERRAFPPRPAKRFLPRASLHGGLRRASSTYCNRSSASTHDKKRATAGAWRRDIVFRARSMLN